MVVGFGETSDGGVSGGNAAAAGSGDGLGAPGNPPKLGAGLMGAALGEVTVVPQTGQGPLIPARWEGTVSSC